MSAGLTEQGKALGEPADFEWDGKSWKIGPIDFDVEMRFSAALQARAAEGLRRNAVHLGGGSYQDALRQFNDDVACQEFDWNGRIGTAARFSVNGSAELLYLCLVKNHDRFSRDDLRRLMREPGPDDGKELPDGVKPRPSKIMEAFDIVRRLTEPPPNGSGPAAP